MFASGTPSELAMCKKTLSHATKEKKIFAVLQQMKQRSSLDAHHYAYQKRFSLQNFIC